MFSHIHRVCGHMSDPYIKWHRKNSKNAKFTDADAKKVRPLCISDIGYKIEHTPPRDKYAGGIAERTVGLPTGKTNTAMMENMASKSMWCWAMFKASQDLNFEYNEKIKTSPYHFVTGQHIDMKYLHSFFAECYMFIPLKDRVGKLPHRRAQRCKFLAYSYTTILVPMYIVLIVNDNGTYGNMRVSKDIIFDESVVFDKFIDNSPIDGEFAALPVIIENVHKELHEKVRIVWFGDKDRHEQVHMSDPRPDEILEPEPTGRRTSPQLEIYNAQEYQDAHPEDTEAIVEPLPLVLTDTSEYEPDIDEYGMPVYWSKITREESTAPVLDIGVFNLS